MSLVVSQLRFCHGGAAALRFNFDFRAEAGEIVGISGRSGAGKSTLLELIAGFLSPQSGTLTFKGSDLAGVPPGKRPVSILFQKHNLFEHLSAWQNVALGVRPSLRLNEADTALVARAFTDMDLSGFEHRGVDRLSGGQQQRVALARTLVSRRPVLLLDEPFAALDRTTRDAMLALVSGLARKTGQLVLLVSHEAGDIARIADRLLVVRDGHLIENDPASGDLSTGCS